MTRVSDLAGAELALWVARAAGVDAVLSDCGGRCLTYYGRDHSGKMEGRDYSPHAHWSDGGPLIEKHSIAIFKGEDRWAAQMRGEPPAHWIDTGIYDEITGPTPLVAAMRALVASVYGDTVPVEVPA